MSSRKIINKSVVKNKLKNSFLLKTFYTKIVNLRNRLDGIDNKYEELSKILESATRKIKNLEFENDKLNRLMIDNYKNVLYYHGGSGNHGCEALAKTIVDIADFKKDETCIYSYVPEDDYKFKLNEKIKYINKTYLDTSELIDYNFSEDTIALSIGGDNYCYYPGGTDSLAQYNKRFNELGAKTALIGCSIEPYILEDSCVLNDLNRYSIITARETITYDALIKSGIKSEIHLIPDSAFTLKPEYRDFPENFIEGATIGINISDLIQKESQNTERVLKNYTNLIEYIIDNTKYQIAFIPHVVQPHNNDMESLKKLLSLYESTGRVFLIDDNNCNVLKGYISKCKILVAARTHASIAAYSTNVPTIVMGYSVKSKGIAKDIFGQIDNYVLDVNNLKTEEDLLNSFKWMEKNYSKIKKHLEKMMPDYIKRCYELKNIIENLRKNKNIRSNLALRNECTGCTACLNTCPQKCIKMVEDKKGFLYPAINYKKCNDCKLCTKVCPINNKFESNIGNLIYAAKNKDEKIRQNSSSGGMFSIFAKEIIKNNGIVFGVAFTNTFEVGHIEINNEKNLKLLYGSKYIQSNLNDTFKKIKTYLKEDKKVLFSGTPCQIQGLKSYLGKNYFNLLCIDFICHGVPSSFDFKEKCKKIENEFNSKIISINFRYKEQGWKNTNIKYTLENKKEIVKPFMEDEYMAEFLKNLNLRESCYNCKAKNISSKSDITLGDFWGIENHYPDFDDNKGVSVIFLNTNLGKNIFDSVKNKIEYIPIKLEEVERYNLNLTKSATK